MANNTMMNRTDDNFPITGVSQEIAPNILRMTSNVTRNGKAKNRSVTRITTSSKRPPRNPAIDPIRHPIATEMIAENKPMMSDTRTPKIKRLYRSRPMSSVPSHALARGDRNELGGACTD